MADDNLNNAAMSAAERKKAHQRRRQVLRYFGQVKTQEALRESILGVSGATPFDCERIVVQLGAHLNDYLGVGSRIKFRELAGAWAARQAELTVRLRAMLPDLTAIAHSVPGCCGTTQAMTMLFLRLPEYMGDVTDSDAFTEWATATTVRETKGIVAFSGWIEDHRKAVYRGIWDVLGGCLDLGVGGCDPYGYHPVVEEIAASVWLWVSHHAGELVEEGAPLHIRLEEKAYWFAREWKTARLRERARFINIADQAERIDQMDRSAGNGKLPPRPIILGPGDVDAFAPLHTGVDDLADYDKPLEHATGYPDEAPEHALAD